MTAPTPNLEITPEGGMKRRDDPGEPSTGLPRIGIAPDEIPILRALALNRYCCEIGTGIGQSTMAMFDTAEEVTTIDIDPWVHEHVWPGLPPSVRKLDSQGGQSYFHLFDLIFIDGDHRPEAFKADVEWAVSHASPWGLIVAHDAHELEPHIPPSWWRIPTTYGMALTIV